MHNRFVGWLKGNAPQCVGMYWGQAGVCLAHSGVEQHCVYIPPGPDGDLSQLAIAIQKLEVLVDIAKRGMALAVAIDADDVFVRSLTVPAGLSDAQLEQVAIVEAVANLPVPPEEICLDFIRGEKDIEARNESVRLAFCRRERIDELLATAESVPVPVGLVDRDVQALHDAVVHCLSSEQMDRYVSYPMALLMAEINPRLVICLDELSFDIYPIKMPLEIQADTPRELLQQIGNCWTRWRMARGGEALVLKTIICVGNGLPDDTSWLREIAGDSDFLACHLPVASLRQQVPQDGLMPPDEALLIAIGMARRALL